MYWFVLFLTVLFPFPVHAVVTPCNYLSETCGAERCVWLEERSVVETASLGNRPLSPCRIGEAQNPGPSNLPHQFTIISANVRALRPRWLEVAHWPASVLALQEVKLSRRDQPLVTADFRTEGWASTWGLPQPLIESEYMSRGAQRHTKRWIPANGGVGILSSGVAPLLEVPRDELAEELRATGRWHEAAIPVENGRTVVYVASVWGHSGSSSDAALRRVNESLWANSILRMLSMGDVPYFLCGDFNCAFSESRVLTMSKASGKVVDLAEMWNQTVPTFCRTGPRQGVTGPGITRIDCILGNRVAAAAVQSFTPRYDLVVADHLPLEVRLDVSVFSVKHRIFEKPRGLISADTVALSQAENELLLDRTFLKVEPMFVQSISSQRLQEAHDLWCRAAHDYCRGVVGKAPLPLAKACRRGVVPRFVEQPVAAKVLSVTHGAITSREQTLAKLGRRFREYSIKRTRHLQCPVDSEPCWSDQAQALALWTRLRKDFLRCLEEAPKACWTEAQPDPGNLELCGDDLRKQLARCMGARHHKRLQDWRQYMRKEWEDNYGRAVYRWIRNDKSTPTVALRVNNKGNSPLTANPTEIHHLFEKEWSKVFKRFLGANSEPDFAAFEARYRVHLDAMATPIDLPPVTGAELYTQVKRMSTESSPGLDGFTVRELQLLPECAWNFMAQLLTACEESQFLPESYLWASTAMLPKDGGQVPLKHRPITLFVLLWRVYSGARWQQIQSWQESFVHRWVCGARKGHTMSEVLLPLFLDIEQAHVNGDESPVFGCFLDYTKYFDFFSYEFTWSFLQRIGWPPRVLALMRPLYAGLTRVLKIGSSFGEPFRPTNGVGQGCSLSLGIVNAMVTLWMLVIQEKDPTCRAGAIIDDRNVRTNTCDQLRSVLTESAHFDELSGHSMNTSKTVVFSTSVKGRKQLSKLRVRGVSFKQSHVVKILGQQLSVVKATRREMANAVVREARVALGRVPALSLPQDDAQRVIESAVIPTITSGAGLFTFPSISLLRSCRAAAVKAVWGTKRGNRAAELVLALTTKAHRVDPFSACAYSYIQDIRRTLIRCPDVTEQFCQILNHYQVSEVPVSAKCMNGPVQHLRTVLWYLDMELTSDLRIHRDGRVPFQWLEQQDGWWGHELREHVRQSLVADVQTRVTKEQPDRKDMQDLTTQLDFDACRALLLGKTYPGSSRPSQHSQQDSDTPRNPAEAAGEPLSGLERHRLKTILTGSVRTNHRLAAAGIIESPGCNFCAECIREDHEHLFWHCPGPGGVYKRIRDHWLPLAQQVQAKMVQCVNFFEIRCLRHHGLLPADPRFAQAWDKIPQVDESDPEPPDVDPGGLSDRWVQSGYEIVITDGATTRQENHILRRSGFGLFYGMGDPRNSSDPLATFSQQPYRAELRAVLRAFRWARWPTWVWLDNAAVVHVVNQMLQGNHRCPSVQGDLWVRMVELISEAPADFFRCSWKKGHATDEIIAAGVLTREEAARQANADILATQGARLCDFDPRLVDYATQRIQLTMLVQRMLLDIWTARLEHERATALALAEEEAQLQAWEEAEEDDPWDPGGREQEQCTEHPAANRLIIPTEQTRLENLFPTYPWGRPQQTVKVEVGPQPSRMGASRLKHRGLWMNTEISFPRHLWQPVCWYFSELQWGPSHAGAGEVEHPWERQVTLAELVVDFELATGVKIVPVTAATEADVTWAGKCQIFRSMIKKVDRICGFSRGSLSSWAPFSKKVRTLSPFGFEFLQGLLCRPKFLCPRASWMIARNAYHAAEDCRGRRRSGAQPVSARGCLVPLLDVKLSYTGVAVAPLWQDPVLARLEDALQEPRELPPVRIARVRWRALSTPNLQPGRLRWRALSMVDRGA